MRVKILILGLIFLVLIACKKGIENPYSPKLEASANVSLHNVYPTFSPRYWDWPKEPPWPTEAEFIVTGNLQNDGDVAAENVMLTAKIYDDEWTVLWTGEYLATNRLDGLTGLSFEARWLVDIAIFCELDETGKPLNEDNWDYNKTMSHGLSVAWE